MRNATVASYRLPPREITPDSLLEIFREADRAVRSVRMASLTSYHLWTIAADQFGKRSPGRMEKVPVTEIPLAGASEGKALSAIEASYGPPDVGGNPEYSLVLSWNKILMSLVEIQFNRVQVDGPHLSTYKQDVSEELRAYRQIKDLMDALNAEECWGSLDDGIEYQAGYGPYYGADMVSFHFRKAGPQSVIAGLEEGIAPTYEMGSSAHGAEPFLHGYRRQYLRLIDLPWDEYWRREITGESLPYRLYTEEDNERIVAEQQQRHLKAEPLINGWNERGEYPLNEGFVSME